MAGIQTAISLTNGMSPALRQITNALNMTINTFENLQSASNSAINTTSITAARQALAGATVEINRMEQEYGDVTSQINQSTAAQRGLNRQIDSGSNVAGDLLSKAKGLIGAYVGMQTAAALVNMTDNYTDTLSRLDLINDGLQTTAELQEMIRDSANNTFSDYKATADMVGKLGIQAGKAFSNNKELIAFAEQVNKHLAVAGTSTAAAEGAMLQMTQAMGAGVLRGEELNSMLEGMPTLVNSITDYFAKMGDTRAIKQIAEEGLITADVVKAALFAAADETNAKFDAMGVTFGDIWNLFKNEADAALTPVYKKLGELTNNKDFQKFVVAAAKSIAFLAGIAVAAFDALGKIAAFVANNWSHIAPFIVAATAAAITYGAAIAWSNRQKVIDIALSTAQAVKTAVYTAATIAAAFATGGFTAGMAALNVVMYANPVGLIIAAVVILIGLFYAAVAAINKVCGTSVNATGIIVGAFYFLGAAVWNIIAYMWNGWSALVEFLANVFKNPVYSIKRLIVNLATNVIDSCIAMTKGWDKFATSIANAFISAVNMVIKAWNKLVDFLPDNVASALGFGKGTTFEARTSITSDLENMKGNLQGMLGERPDNYWVAPKMQQKELAQAYKNGYKVGENFSNGFGKKTAAEEIAASLAGTSELGAIPSQALADIGKTADNTGKAADSLEGTSEEIQLLRNIAEREAINRVTTAEIKIDMTNNNSVSSEMDLDGMVNKLTDKLYDAMANAAEGVHI